MKISAFDLDHTLTTGNSSFNFCHFLLKRKILSASSVLDSGICYLRHLFFGMSVTELHHAIFNRILSGLSMHLLEEEVDLFLRQHLFNSLYMPAVYRLRLAQHLGHYTVILSNSPSFLVKSVAAFLGVNEWRATEYALDKEDKLERIALVLQGADKAHHLKSLSQKFGIHQEAITAYSDSYLDLDFLKASGTPVAVNPDKKLRALSLEKKWSII